MSRQRTGLNAADVCRLAVALFWLIIMAGAGAAQQGPPAGAGRPENVNPKTDVRDIQNREFRLRNMEAQATSTSVDPKRLEAAIDLVKQDFKRIQLIRNDMVDNLVAKKPLDFKLITEQAGEINKRAGRLKLYLLPPVPVDDKEKIEKLNFEFDARETQGALVRLCNLIYSFTQNPILKNPGMIDVQQSTRAGGDLLSIIDLSDTIRRSAEKLARASK
jgi:hypothetical protein